MDDFRITGLGDGFLIGVTYFPKGDRVEGFEDEDWSELNIFLYKYINIYTHITKNRKKYTDRFGQSNIGTYT